LTTPLTPPVGLRPRGRGRRLWRQVLAGLELDSHELGLLTETCRTLDLLDTLAELAGEHGLLTPDGRMAPYVVEGRLQRIALSRLVASLRLPESLSEPIVPSRPQRRGAARGPYGLKVIGGNP